MSRKSRASELPSLKANQVSYANSEQPVVLRYFYDEKSADHALDSMLLEEEKQIDMMASESHGRHVMSGATYPSVQTRAALLCAFLSADHEVTAEEIKKIERMNEDTIHAAFEMSEGILATIKKRTMHAAETRDKVAVDRHLRRMFLFVCLGFVVDFFLSVCFSSLLLLLLLILILPLLLLLILILPLLLLLLPLLLLLLLLLFPRFFFHSFFCFSFFIFFIFSHSFSLPSLLASS